ncbi:MAG: PilT/PilU family type 4a pilus ATPase, partial [Chloroflexi bacterium]|nr:PilT/PilU family type 4a pilus ATPase [Chloroflexota bacterium]
MSYIDDVVRYMTEQKATAFVMPAGKNMVMQVGDQSYPQQQTIAANQLAALIQQAAPASMQSQIGQPGEFEFPYLSANGPCLLKVRQNNGSLELTILAQGAAAPTAVQQGQAARTHVSTGDPKADAVLNIPADRVGTRTVEHLDEMFHLLFELNGSDLHCASKDHPVMRLHGTLHKLPEYQRWSSEELKKLIWDITPGRNKEEWEETKDTDFAYELPGLARFRCNVYSDRHGIAATFRLIPSKVLTIEDLKLPKAMTDLCFLSKGLVIVTGPTGSGKSTTLAALVDYVNRIRTDHIITIEDPIEFVHENNQCLVNQREVHVHTDSFKKALRAALREDPDIVMVGEMRDLETVAIAIETAETGHLVFATLHTSSAASTVDRVIDQFPADQQEQIRVMLSESLKAIVAQILLRKKTGGRVAAWEILLCPPAVANLIRENKTFQLTSMIQVNKGIG